MQVDVIRGIVDGTRHANLQARDAGGGQRILDALLGRDSPRDQGHVLWRAVRHVDVLDPVAQHASHVDAGHAPCPLHAR